MPVVAEAPAVAALPAARGLLLSNANGVRPVAELRDARGAVLHASDGAAVARLVAAARAAPPADVRLYDPP